MDVYAECPRVTGDRFLLRLVEDRDAADLLRVYSDPLSLPLFNGDNCNGDDFHYQTIERMAQAITFWRQAYAWRAFVRWAIEDQRTGEAVGTMELFHRKAADDRPLRLRLVSLRPPDDQGLSPRCGAACRPARAGLCARFIPHDRAGRHSLSRLLDAFPLTAAKPATAKNDGWLFHFSAAMNARMSASRASATWRPS